MITLQVYDIKEMSTVDGRGVRYTVFLSGCKHHCVGCHSPHTWDFNAGTKMYIRDIFYDIYDKREFIDGVSFSGGDPIEQIDNLLPLLKMLKLVGFDIWLWTGYTFDFLNDNHKDALTYLDTIIDGKFDLNAPTTSFYKGSSNQRMWVKKNNKYEEVKE